jgi:transposase
VIDAAGTLKRQEARLASYFSYQMSNPGAEGLNSPFQAICVPAGGYRNREHFKTAIWFPLGDLQLYPILP